MSPAAEVGVTVRMTSDQHALLKARATSEHRTVTQELRRMIELHLAGPSEEESRGAMENAA